jgi:hypothetical protein
MRWICYDAYPKREHAEERAAELRTFQGRVDRDFWTLAKVVDLGEEGGRLRYAVYIARGSRI